MPLDTKASFDTVENRGLILLYIYLYYQSQLVEVVLRSDQAVDRQDLVVRD